jgi:hypothetical protein
MSDIIEILGEKKFVGSKNKELKSRIVFEETKKMKYESNLFFDVSQQTQFINEKINANKIRVYGKINPVINSLVHQKIVDNKDSLIEVDKDLFNMNLNNWSIVVLKSKRFESETDSNGVQKYIKGVKKLDKKTNSSDVIIDLDFKRGLPAREYLSKVNTDNFCMFLPLGHNFIVGDKIKVDSINTDVLDSKIYTVVNIIGNLIYINTRPIKNINVEQNVEGTDALVKPLEDFKLVSDNNLKVKNEGLKQVIRNLKFTRAEVLSIINTSRPKIQTLIKPEFYVSKIVEKEILEYYIKTLEVIGIIDELDVCAFSINNFNQPIYNFYLSNDLNISDLYDNLNQPVSDLYIGVIKKGAPIVDIFSNVESHFNMYIENVGVGYGIEKITDNTIGINSKPKIGDEFFHSICEYSTENLTETEIEHIHHRIIHKNILFSYKPFTKVEIKLKSTYIEDGDNIENIPNYAIYSRQREKYIWRDIFDVGVTDEDGRIIDLPFMNGSFYTFNDINFFLIPETEYVRRYELNVNDVTSINGSEFSNEFNDAFKNLDLDESNSNTIKPFNEYQDLKC